MRSRYGYFNQPDEPASPSVIGVPVAGGASKRKVAATAKKVRKFGGDLITMNQILGGMVGFAGTNTISSILQRYLPYNEVVLRGLAGGITYGAAWFFVNKSGGLAANKNELKKAVFFGIVLNIAISLLTSGVDVLKSKVGLGEYDMNAAPTPQQLHPGEQTYEGEYSYN